jgi:hypothetical protein
MPTPNLNEMPSFRGVSAPDFSGLGAAGGMAWNRLQRRLLSQADPDISEDDPSLKWIQEQKIVTPASPAERGKQPTSTARREVAENLTELSDQEIFRGPLSQRIKSMFGRTGVAKPEAKGKLAAEESMGPRVAPEYAGVAPTGEPLITDAEVAETLEEPAPVLADDALPAAAAPIPPEPRVQPRGEPLWSPVPRQPPPEIGGGAWPRSPGGGFAGMEPLPPAPEQGGFGGLLSGIGGGAAKLGGDLVNVLLGPGSEYMSRGEKAMALIMALGQGAKTGLAMPYGYQGPSFIEAARGYGGQFYDLGPEREYRDYLMGQTEMDPAKAEALRELAGIPMDPAQRRQIIEDSQLRVARERERLRDKRPIRRKRVSINLGNGMTQDFWDDGEGNLEPMLHPETQKPIIYPRSVAAKKKGGLTDKERTDAAYVTDLRAQIVSMDGGQLDQWIDENPTLWTKARKYYTWETPEQRDFMKKIAAWNDAGRVGEPPRLTGEAQIQPVPANPEEWEIGVPYLDPSSNQIVIFDGEGFVPQ